MPLCYVGLEGDPCDGADADCAPAHHCAWDEWLGASQCYDGGEGDPCDGDSDCAPVHHCVWIDAEGRELCFDGSAGDPCADGGDCAPGASSCAWNPGTARMECTPAA